MPTDWQPHEQLSGGSSPAEDWTEPMVDATGSSNPPEGVEQRAWTTCPVCYGVGASTETVTRSPEGIDTRTVTPCRACKGTGMVDAGKLVDERVAELEAELAALKQRRNSPLQPHERPGRDWRQS